MEELKLKRYILVSVVVVLLAVLLVAFILPGVAQQQSKSGLRVFNANAGQVVNFEGQGTPNTDVYIEVTTKTSINAPGGRYGISLNGIKIPSGTNRFSITAENVDTMTVAGSSLTNSQISAAQGVEVGKNSVGSLSKSNIPAGTYNLMIYGSTKDSKIDVSASAGCMVHVDSNGNYYSSVSTQGMPPGMYKVKQDNKEIAHIYLS
jgi:LEA14-like dessication related protein